VFSPAVGVRAAPPVSGLVGSAARPNPPDVPRWENGLAWVPERCGTAYQLVPWCADPPSYTPPRPGSVYHQPVGVRIADECTTLGGRPDLDRARRVAEAQLPYIVARELWLGTGSSADPYKVTPGGANQSNAYLASADADIVGSGGAEATAALGRLEQAALDTSHGQPVMLHVPVMASWQVADHLTRVGNQMLTAAGNQVVFDGGYPGTGPAGQAVGATAWAYATSPVAVLVADWDVQADDAEVVDRAKNTCTTWASTVFAAVWDPCVHLATEITL
jgi:hypothetical protein